jgi:hypothetical protein
MKIIHHPIQLHPTFFSIHLFAVETNNLVSLMMETTFFFIVHHLFIYLSILFTCTQNLFIHCIYYK